MNAECKIRNAPTAKFEIRSPSPRPSPHGEGDSFTGLSRCRAVLQCPRSVLRTTSVRRQANWLSLNPTRPPAVPSPGREGQGEGERSTQPCLKSGRGRRRQTCLAGARNFWQCEIHEHSCFHTRFGVPPDFVGAAGERLPGQRRRMESQREPAQPLGGGTSAGG